MCCQRHVASPDARSSREIVIVSPIHDSAAPSGRKSRFDSPRVPRRSAAPPRRSTRGQRIFGGILALVLAAAVIVPFAIASRYAFATSDLVQKVFDNPLDLDGPEAGPDIDPSDPWRNIPRLNLLIVGGDPTDNGGLTTNTMIVASIDTTTGDTVLFGIPRNLKNAPIPAENPLPRGPHGVRADGGPVILSRQTLS